MSAHQNVQPFSVPEDGGRAPQLRALEPSETAITPAGPGLSELARAIAARIRQKPLSSVAVAVGIGFAVGGALTFRAGRLALAAAARHVARELLKQIL
jgi:hypothetical protein